jgi:hypothetical protein
MSCLVKNELFPTTISPVHRDKRLYLMELFGTPSDMDVILEDYIAGSSSLSLSTMIDVRVTKQRVAGCREATKHPLNGFAGVRVHLHHADVGRGVNVW